MSGVFFEIGQRRIAAEKQQLVILGAYSALLRLRVVSMPYSATICRPLIINLETLQSFFGPCPRQPCMPEVTLIRRISDSAPLLLPI